MVRPQPDRGPRIQSLMLTGRAAAACMSAAQLEADSLCPAAARARQRIASGASLAPSARVRAVQVVADFVALRDLGRSCLDAADELAEEGRNFRSQVKHKKTALWAAAPRRQHLCPQRARSIPGAPARAFCLSGRRSW
jgi:hypothetical protein